MALGRTLQRQTTEVETIDSRIKEAQGSEKWDSITKLVVGILMLCSLIAITSGITGFTPLRGFSHLSQAARIGAQITFGVTATSLLLGGVYIAKQCGSKKTQEVPTLAPIDSLVLATIYENDGSSEGQ